jgi:hypothetical protein
MSPISSPHLSEISRRQVRGCWADRAFLALVVVLAALSVRTVEMAVHAGAMPGAASMALSEPLTP